MSNKRKVNDRRKSSDGITTVMHLLWGVRQNIHRLPPDVVRGNVIVDLNTFSHQFHRELLGKDRRRLKRRA